VPFGDLGTKLPKFEFGPQKCEIADVLARDDGFFTIDRINKDGEG
jgi:hypothetical protein